MRYDLSVIIPSRQEEFLSGTIEKLLEKIRGNTEIIAVLDGAWTNPEIPQHERVNIIYVPEAIGQRAATNLGAKLSRSRYLMKLDAHCLWDEGLDVKMLEAFKETGDNVTLLPVMRNLWLFDWKCYRCGWRIYQDKSPQRCGQCDDSRYLRKKMLWIGKHNPQSTSFCFDTEPKFRYFEDYKHRPQYIKDKEEKGLTETMSIQGSCFMVTREKYWELNICDEKLGSWGNQGIEVALKTWLSGGRVLVNHKTWYAHLFRTKTNFGFPWPVSGRAQLKTKQNVKDLFWNSNWPKAIHPISWLLEKFWPVSGWDDKALAELKNTANITDLTNYKDASNVISCQIYQEAT